MIRAFHWIPSFNSSSNRNNTFALCDALWNWINLMQAGQTQFYEMNWAEIGNCGSWSSPKVRKRRKHPAHPGTAPSTSAIAGNQRHSACKASNRRNKQDVRTLLQYPIKKNYEIQFHLIIGRKDLYPGLLVRKAEGTSSGFGRRSYNWCGWRFASDSGDFLNSRQRSDCLVNFQLHQILNQRS